MYIGVHMQCLLLLSDYNKSLIFSTDFRKTLKYKIPLKPVQWEQSFSCGRTGGRTDMTKLIVAFRRFANAHKKVATTIPELATFELQIRQHNP